MTARPQTPAPLQLILGGAIERRDLGPWAAVRGIVTAGGAP